MNQVVILREMRKICRTGIWSFCSSTWFSWYNYTCKDILHSGSQSNFISEDLRRRLGMSKQNIELSLSGIGQKILSSAINVPWSYRLFIWILSHSCQVLVAQDICSLFSSYHVNVSAFLIDGNVGWENPTFLILCHFRILDLFVVKFLKIWCVRNSQNSGE